MLFRSLLAALGTCISMTTMLYARRKEWPVERVTVRLRHQRVHFKDCQECEHTKEGFIHRIGRSVAFAGDLSDEQRSRLQEIAYKCPIHKTLTSEIVVVDLQEV